MGVDIRLEDKNGNKLDESPDLENLLSRLLPAWDDAIFHCLRYVDPWGETIFNHLQMDELISELRKIRAKAATEEERAFIDNIESMAMRCKDENLYLKFLGD
ncbi:MAG: hypothetical protein WBP79_15270 [Candidatus Acidiferrales bacterium]